MIGSRLTSLPMLMLSLITITFVVIMGVVRSKTISSVVDSNDVSQYFGNFVELKVKVLPNYVVKSTYITADVECISAEVEGITYQCIGKIRVSYKKYYELDIGEIVVMKAKLLKPENFSEDFSYVDYLSDQGVTAVMYYPEIISTGEYEINPFVKLLYDIRKIVIAKIGRYFPEPHASLLSGVLLGVKNAMPEGLSESLRRTGTTHIIAASGYNVTIISGFLISMLKFLNRRVRMIVGIMFVWVFVIISGGSVPVVRAAIMVSMSLFALLFGRSVDITQSLIFSAAVMFVVDNDVYQNISFQLSFMSTAGLVYIVPIIKKWLFFIPKWLEESITVTLSAILATFPITTMNFHSFSIISPVANLLLLPTVAITMLLGSIFIIIPEFLGGVLTVVSTILWVPLDYFIRMVGFLSKLSFSSIEIPNFSIVMLAICYLLMIFVIFRYSRVDDHEIL